METTILICKRFSSLFLKKKVSVPCSRRTPNSPWQCASVGDQTTKQQVNEVTDRVFVMPDELRNRKWWRRHLKKVIITPIREHKESREAQHPLWRTGPDARTHWNLQQTNAITTWQKKHDTRSMLAHGITVWWQWISLETTSLRLLVF